MTDEQKTKLKLLSIEYKEAYRKAAELIEKRDEIKNQIKELVGDEDTETDTIKISHVTKKVIDYKGFVTDAKVEVPDTYKSERTETRVTLKKDKVKSNPNE